MRSAWRILLPYAVAIGAVEALLVAAHLSLPDIALVDLDKEHTLPAWFSALQLAAIGGTCLFAFEAERRDVAYPPWSTWIWPLPPPGASRWATRRAF